MTKKAKSAALNYLASDRLKWMVGAPDRKAINWGPTGRKGEEKSERNCLFRQSILLQKPAVPQGSDRERRPEMAASVTHSVVQGFHSRVFISSTTCVSSP
ncbi:unnamed protein product [Bursaphelenchus okinawaensis]|uniref:Uncharacterized protein n=1 Tax=Bursaphelenchus okinawaensis TaxID=465554 RepID=A0A811KR12_9BILA|nr:unnamed protein product [Bursaphelenchus okinawaensis]CAG9108422.1 unnamed protein product [Bursaphelenchus okinawaensis]